MEQFFCFSHNFCGTSYSWDFIRNKWRVLRLHKNCQTTLKEHNKRITS